MVRGNQYLHVILSNEQRTKARDRALRIKYDPTLEKNKYRSEALRTYFGFLGEEMVSERLGLRVLDTFEFDLSGKKEVKSISCSFKPPSYFLAGVNSSFDGSIRRQAAERYIFTRILADASRGWILGWITCEEFWRIGVFIPKGQELYPGQKAEKADGTFVEIKQLYPMED